MWWAIRHFVIENGPLSYWLIAFLLAGFATAVYKGFIGARMIQPKGFSQGLQMEDFPRG